MRNKFEALQHIKERIFPPSCREEILASTPFKIVDLLAMTRQEELMFKKQVQTVRGHVDILVHPWYEEDNPKAVFPVSEEYVQTRDNLILSCLYSGKPLIIFEEDDETKYQHLTERFTNQEKGVLYVVKTRTDRPIPAIDGTSENALHVLRTILKRGGVKHASIGGRHMILKPSDQVSEETRKFFQFFGKGKKGAKTWLDKGLIPYGCPGGLMIGLLMDFDVSVSPASSPSSSLEPTELNGAFFFPPFNGVFEDGGTKWR